MSFEAPEPLELLQTRGGLRYALHKKALFGGDTIALCFSGGWVMGRFEWDSDPESPPRFHCSIELAGGRVEPVELPIPPGGALHPHAADDLSAPAHRAAAKPRSKASLIISVPCPRPSSQASPIQMSRARRSSETTPQ